MFERILVPLDGSAPGEACLPLLGKLNRWQSPHAVLVNVLDPRLLDANPAEQEHASSLARTYLEEIGTMLQMMNIPSSSIARVGPVAETLLDAAKEENVSLVAISTHGRLTPPTLPYGSVAAQLFRSSPFPILVAPSAALEASPGEAFGDVRPFRSILVVASGDARHRRGFQVPAEVAVQTGAEVVLLRLALPADSGRGEAEERVDAEEYLDQLGALFGRRRISTDLVIEQGDPVNAIQELAPRRRVDLIACSLEMASSNASERTAFDSLLRKTRIPLLLFRSEGYESTRRQEEPPVTKRRAP